MRKWTFIFVVGVLGCTVLPARAALIAYDGFESYSAGSALAGGSAGNGSTGPNGEIGWTGNWATTPPAGGAVTVQSAAVVGGGSRAAELDDTANSINVANRTFTPQTGSTVYFSVLFDVVGGLNADDFVHFYLGNSTTSNNNSGGFGLVDTGNTKLSAREGTTNGGTTTTGGSSATDAVVGTTYLLVGKLSKVSSTNYNRIDLFINPVGLTEPGTPDAFQAGVDTTISTVSVFSVRGFNLDAGDKYQFDEVKVGTTFVDVVPEPATAGLLTVAAVTLLARRRRTV